MGLVRERSRAFSYFLSSNVTFSLPFLGLATGISLKNVSIPHYGVKDGTISLLCDFDIESDVLLDLKWYKNEEEFFRYIPTAKPNILTFSVEGVSVDVSDSMRFPRIVLAFFLN